MARLDQYLVNNNYVISRNKAATLIKNNKVKVDGKIINKASYEVDSPNIEILESEELEFVSRGGLKLKKAIEYFNLDFNNKIICDIGASSGGFSDCALKHNAKYVYAIDVGTNQLVNELRNDKRVKSYENTNFKDVDLSYFDSKIDYYVCDVSFISIEKIIKHLIEIEDEFEFIGLFKPQFEVGKDKINSKGLVKKDIYLIEALTNFIKYINDNHLYLKGITYSPIKGNKSGNIEFLVYINNKEGNISYNLKELVTNAKEQLKDD